MKNQPLSDVGQPNPPSVQAGPASPLFAICGIVAFLISCLAVLNAMGRTMGIVLAVVAILLAFVALLEIFIPRERGGRVAAFTVSIAVVAVVISGIRLSGQSVLGKSLPADDSRATPSTMPA